SSVPWCRRSWSAGALASRRRSARAPPRYHCRGPWRVIRLASKLLAARTYSAQLYCVPRQFKLRSGGAIEGGVVRGTRTAGVLVTMAASLFAPAALRALQTTVGGRSVDLDTTLSIREVIEENGATKHERTLEQLRVRAAASLTNWLRFDSTTIGSNGG